MALVHKLKTTLEMIKFEHTVFALPFALTGAFLAADGVPRGWQLFWIVTAMVGARSAAMTFNRIVDVRFDAANPRTMSRALAAGALGLPFAAGFTVISSVLFVYSAFRLNWLCFYLSFPVLGILFLYSYTKRFTSLSHLVLGFSIGLAPLAAWLAVRGEFGLPPALLAGAVLLWVAGFDVIYALQDEAFDRKAGLMSIPARWGIRPALWCSAGMHAGTVILLFLTAWLTKLGWIAYTGVAIAAGILVWEHWIVKPSDLSRINVAFFNLNGYISILLFLFFATALLVR